MSVINRFIWNIRRHLLDTKFPVLLRCTTRRHYAVSSISTSDADTILNHINTASHDELCKWSSFTKKQVASILLYRDQVQHFHKLTDLLVINGLGQRTLMKFMSEYLGKEDIDVWPWDMKKQKLKVERTIMYPKYMSTELPESVVSCGIQLDAIYWARITHDLTVTDWKCTPLPDHMRQRYDHLMYQDKFWNMMQSLPTGDLYLMDDIPILTSAVSAMAGALNRARLEAILTTCINLRHNQLSSASFQNKVHKIKHSEVGSYFGLMVGGERVSSQKVAVDIFKGQRLTSYGDFYVPQDLTQNFWDGKRAVKEQMSNCLLQAVMFYEYLLKQQKDTDTIQ